MATNWPSSVQTFTNPTSGSSLSSPSHADQHATVNDTVEALQNYAGMVFVKSVAIGSSVSSITVSNAFDSRFRSYKIIISHDSQSGSGVEYRFRLGSTTTGYYYTQIAASFGSTITAYGNTNYTEWRVGAGRTGEGGTSVLELHKPYLTQTTLVNWQSGYPYADTTGGSRNGFGMLDNTTSYTDFNITPSGGTFTGGHVIVYGYNEGA